MRQPPKVVPRFAFRSQSLAGDLHRMRLRERYLETQFPDYLALRRRNAPADEVVALANGLFEDGEMRIAAEVLTVAIQDQPKVLAYWLGLAELLYLEHDGPNLSALIDAFGAQFPDAPERPVMMKLGARLSPRSAPFIGMTVERDEIIPGWLRTASHHGDPEAAAELHALLVAESAAP